MQFHPTECFLKTKTEHTLVALLEETVLMLRLQHFALCAKHQVKVHLNQVETIPDDRLSGKPSSYPGLQQLLSE